MAKKSKSTNDKVLFNGIAIRNELEAVSLLGELEEITKEIEPLMRRQVDIKKAVTEYAVEKKLDVITLDDCYYRQVSRATRSWVATDNDMPDPKPKGAKSLYSLVKDKTVKVNGKPKKLWALITRRVPDPTLIDYAVRQGWVTEKEIEKAFIEKPQAPFLTRYQGSPS